jgi:hypothetical protein
LKLRFIICVLERLILVIWAKTYGNIFVYLGYFVIYMYKKNIIHSEKNVITFLR